MKYILIVDEPQLHHDGITGTRNSHSLLHNKQHEEGKNSFQHRFLVSIWCGIVDTCLRDLHVVEGCLSAALYRHFLENELQLHLEDVPLQIRW
jgi:hypothetical protein